MDLTNVKDLYEAFKDISDNLEGEDRKTFRSSLRDAARRNELTLAMLKAAVDSIGLTLENCADIAKVEKTAEIEAAYKATEVAGCDVSLGFKMKCSFNDALIVKEAASFVERLGGTVMTLKDVSGDIHEDITIADALAAADEMGGSNLALWNIRETKKKEIRDATTFDAVCAITA